MRGLAAIALATALPVCAAAQSAGLMRCGAYPDIAAMLAVDYGEQVRAVLIAGEGEMAFEVWVAEDVQTWTILRRLPHGLACVVASGQGGVMLPEVQGVPG